MRVARLTKNRTIRVTEEPMPELKRENEVLVKVKVVGICGTDLHIFQGERADVSYPRILGHELSGLVIKTGSAVKRVKEGDHVILDPVFGCGECAFCKSGHENVCSQVKCYGVQMDGGNRDYIVVEESHLYSYNKSISYEQAALAEPFSIAANIMSKTMITKSDNVVIIGCGTIGLCILQVVKRIGARVLVTDVVEEKLNRAKNIGADVIVNSKTTVLSNAVNEFATGGASVVIDAVGSSTILEQCLDFTCPTGRIAVIGFDSKPALIPPIKITKKELILTGSRMNCHQFPTVIEWLNQGQINADLMITRRYPVEEIQTAFEETLINNSDVVKTMILFS